MMLIKRKANSGQFKKGQKPWNKGKKNSEETRKKISLVLKGKKYAPGRVSPMKGKTAWNKGKKGVMPEPWNKGKKNAYSESQKKRMSIGQKKRFETKEVWNKGKKLHYTVWQKGKKHSAEALKKMRGRKLTESQKINKSILMKKKYLSGFHPRTGKKHSEKSRKKMSLAKKGKKYAPGRVSSMKGKIPWNKDKKGIFTEEVLEKIREARSKQKFPLKDSKPEKFLQKLCNKTGIEFQKHKKFNLGFQRHDVDLFIEPNICIEVDGDYWHGNPNNYKADGKTHPGLKSDQVIVWGSDKAKTAKWVRENDKKITQALIQQGNQVLRFWQSELEADPEKCLQKIIKIIKESKRI